MNRGLWVLSCLAAGCQFGSPPGDHSGNPADAAFDGSVGQDAASGEDASPDPDASGACRTWQTGFDTNPTMGTVPEWTVRGGGPFPGRLSNGVWQVDNDPALDTTPDHDFPGVTTVTGRLRCTRDNGNRDDECAVLWVNVGTDDDGPTMAGIFVDVHREGQSAVVLLKQRDIGPRLAEHVLDSTTGFVDVRMTIDHPARQVRLEVLPALFDSGWKPYIENVPVNNDRYATAWGARASEFDSVHVESCPE